MAKLSPDETELREKNLENIEKKLKALGFDKEEIKTVIKENIKR